MSTEANGAPILSPPKASRRPLFGFGEGATEERETAGPLSSSLPHPASPSDLESLEELEQDSGSEWPSDEPPAHPGSTSSPASTPAGDVAVLDSEGLRDMFRGGVIIAGDQAHTYLAKSDAQKVVGLYQADEEDAERIGDPLARIAARHQGVGVANPDTQDLLAAMVGLTRYATKQVQRSQDAKRLEAGYGAPAQPTEGAA